ncbi:MAG: transcription antitermination factor NusB [Ruminococcaceae bacterium]|nr:transcription antitermination factor NusB [Oscillospiraceae bacterium]
MNRREARELLFTLVFEYDFKKNEDYSAVYAEALLNRDEIEDDEFVKNNFEGIIVNLEEIDKNIADHASGWRLSRLSRVSLAAMRVAVYEILYCDDIPVNVSINEAIELVKKYDEGKTPKFVNGVLNSVAKSRSGENG